MDDAMQDHLDVIATIEEPTIGDLEQRLFILQERVELLFAENTARGSDNKRKTSNSFRGDIAKQDALVSESIAASAMDAALASLSIEQRIAVKMEMLRSGLIR